MFECGRQSLTPRQKKTQRMALVPVSRERSRWRDVGAAAPRSRSDLAGVFFFKLALLCLCVRRAARAARAARAGRGAEGRRHRRGEARTHAAARVTRVARGRAKRALLTMVTRLAVFHPPERARRATDMRRRLVLLLLLVLFDARPPPHTSNAARCPRPPPPAARGRRPTNAQRAQTTNATRPRRHEDVGEDAQ